MKISELPQATELTGEELVPIVQNGENKKTTRNDFVGDVPDDIEINENIVSLLSRGKKIGKGITLPVPIFDNEMSNTSTNAVQNKIIKAELDRKLSSTGGNMSGNLGLGNNDIVKVKRIIFSEDAGQWLNMSNCPITNVGEPTADNHAATKKYVDNHIGSGYEYVTMLDTTLSEEVTAIYIDKIGNKTFNCIEFYAQLDVPNAKSATTISFDIKRENNSYQGVTTELSTLKTTTDSTKHTLVAIKFTQNSSIFWNSFFGGQIANKNISWNNSYPSVAIYTHSKSANNINADGTTGIRIGGLFPSGTILKVYGKCKLA